MKEHLDRPSRKTNPAIAVIMVRSERSAEGGQTITSAADPHLGRPSAIGMRVRHVRSEELLAAICAGASRNTEAYVDTR